MTEEEFRQYVGKKLSHEVAMYDLVKSRLNQVWISRFQCPTEYAAWIPYKITREDNYPGTGDLQVTAHWKVHCKNVTNVHETKEFDWCLSFTRDYVPFQNNFDKRKDVQRTVDYHRAELVRLTTILELYRNDSHEE